MSLRVSMRWGAPAILGIACAVLRAQTYPAGPLGYSVPTPRPINPAESTTNPSAQATQRQNPYLGSVPQQSTGTVMKLSLTQAIARGLRYNLGLVEAEHASSD